MSAPHNPTPLDTILAEIIARHEREAGAADGEGDEREEMTA